MALTGVGLWLGRRRFLHHTIPSACKAHACFVGVARCSLLGPNIALVVGSVQLPASVGNDNIQSFRYARNSGRIFYTSQNLRDYENTCMKTSWHIIVEVFLTLYTLVRYS